MRWPLRSCHKCSCVFCCREPLKNISRCFPSRTSIQPIVSRILACMLHCLTSSPSCPTTASRQPPGSVFRSKHLRTTISSRMFCGERRGGAWWEEGLGSRQWLATSRVSETSSPAFPFPAPPPVISLFADLGATAAATPSADHRAIAITGFGLRSASPWTSWRW